MDETFKYFYIPKIKEAYFKKFWSTTKIQDFSLPKPIINYLWKNIESPNVYQKLLESCKYFYSKKLYLLLQKIYYNETFDWTLEYYKESKPDFTGFDVRKYDDEKIWITGEFEIWGSDNPVIASEIMTKIYRCDIEKLLLWQQNLLFNDLCRLVVKVKECEICECFFYYENDEEVPFEIIFKNFRNIKEFRYAFPVETKSFTIDSMQKIIEYANFQQLSKFEIESIPTNFDVSYFYNMIKETKSYKKIILDFCFGMPVDFQNQINSINYEILKNSKLDYVPPLFTFPEMNSTILRDLIRLLSLKLRKYNPPACAPPIQQQNFAPSIKNSFQWFKTAIHSSYRTFWYKHFHP